MLLFIDIIFSLICPLCGVVVRFRIDGGDCV